jgi:hypothetical protein
LKNAATLPTFCRNGWVIKLSKTLLVFPNTQNQIWHDRRILPFLAHNLGKLSRRSNFYFWFCSWPRHWGDEKCWTTSLTFLFLNIDLEHLIDFNAKITVQLLYYYYDTICFIIWGDDVWNYENIPPKCIYCANFSSWWLSAKM